MKYVYVVSDTGPNHSINHCTILSSKYKAELFMLTINDTASVSWCGDTCRVVDRVTGLLIGYIVRKRVL